MLPLTKVSLKCTICKVKFKDINPWENRCQLCKNTRCDVCKLDLGNRKIRKCGNCNKKVCFRCPLVMRPVECYYSSGTILQDRPFCKPCFDEYS